jgi:hypothetical protein
MVPGWETSALKVLIVNRRSSLAAPAPITIDEDTHDRISDMQDSRICAFAVEVQRGIVGF